MTGKKFLRQFQREYARVFLASLLNLIEESARYHFALGELWIIRIGADQLAIYISFAVSNVLRWVSTGNTLITPGTVLDIRDASEFLRP